MCNPLLYPFVCLFVCLSRRYNIRKIAIAIQALSAPPEPPATSTDILSPLYNNNVVIGLINEIVTIIIKPNQFFIVGLYSWMNEPV